MGEPCSDDQFGWMTLSSAGSTGVAPSTGTSLSRWIPPWHPAGSAGATKWIHHRQQIHFYFWAKCHAQSDGISMREKNLLSELLEFHPQWRGAWKGRGVQIWWGQRNLASLKTLKWLLLSQRKLLRNFKKNCLEITWNFFSSQARRFRINEHGWEEI